jgi:2-polyprenyl-3-methyl-5-hydroxy-6-metoxy-1,4-benzoquinol methylase
MLTRHHQKQNAAQPPSAKGWQRGWHPDGPIWLCFGKTDGDPGIFLRCNTESGRETDLVCQPWEVTHHTGRVRGIRAYLQGMHLAQADFARTFDNWFEALEVGGGLEIIGTPESPDSENLLREAGFARLQRSRGDDGTTRITGTKVTRKDERQVAPEISGIRPDHLARYELACRSLKPDARVGDFACGVGYGTHLIADQDRVLSVLGADIDSGAIEYAQQHYQTPKTTFVAADLLAMSLEPASLDLITSFETIEHVENTHALLAKFNEALRPGGLLLCSTPNEEVVPHSSFNNPYHHRHYTPAEFATLLEATGFEIIGRYTQTDRQSRTMHEGWHGIYNTAVCRKIKPPGPPPPNSLHPDTKAAATRLRSRRSARIFKRAAKLLARPWHLRAWLRHRAHYHASWRIFYHRLLALKCRWTGRQFVADLDWHGCTHLRLREVVEACPLLQGKVTVRKMPGHFIYDAAEIADAKHAAGNIEATYRQQTFAGHHLWEICRTSIAKELGHVPGESPTPTETATIARYFSRARKCLRGTGRYLDAVKPHAVIVFQGGLYDSRCILECAKRRGIKVIAMENCLLGDHALVDSHSGFILNRHSLAEQGRTLYANRAITDDRLDPVLFFRDRLSLKTTDHRTGGTDIATLGLPSDKKIILLLGQVASDASIVMDSPIYRTTAEFIIAAAALAAANPGWFLVVRLHPKEAWHVDTRGRSDGPGDYLWDNTLQAVKNSEFSLPDNCLLVSDPGISTYELMERADVGLTINSQAGLEMLLLGKPVVTAGRCFYAGNGFTIDVNSQEELETQIIKALQTGLTPEAREELTAFCRYLFGHYLLPKNPQLAALRVARLEEIFGIHSKS